MKKSRKTHLGKKAEELIKTIINISTKDSNRIIDYNDISRRLESLIFQSCKLLDENKSAPSFRRYTLDRGRHHDQPFCK